MWPLSTSKEKRQEPKIDGKPVDYSEFKNKYGETDDYWYGPVTTPSVTGVGVDESQALHYTTVWACVRLISETIASLPLNVYRTLGEKGKAKAPNHPLFDLLHYSPNQEMTAFQWREAGVANLLLWGNWYSYIDRNRANQTFGLWPLNPANMKVKRRGPQNEGPLIYEYHLTNSGEKIIMPPEEVLHIPGLGFNGVIGYSPISMAREAVGLGLASEELASRFFGNDASPGGVLRHPGKLTSQSRDNLKDSLRVSHGGIKNKWLPMILEEGMEWKETTMPFKDAQFLETRKFQRSEICSFFRVPPHLIGDTTPATSWGSGIEQQSIGFIVFVIRPWLVRIEQALRYKLFNDNKRIDFFPEHSVEGLLRGDSAARAAFYKTMWEIGAFSPNDILEKENMNPISDGDKHYVPLNYVEIGAKPIPPKPPVAPPSNIPNQEGSKGATDYNVLIDVADAESFARKYGMEEDDMSVEERQELLRLRQEVLEVRNEMGFWDIEKKKITAERDEFRAKIAEKDDLISKMKERTDSEIDRLNSEIVRLKNTENYQRLFRDAISRIIRRETVAIKRALQRKSLSDFNSYINDFYGELPDFASSTLHPTATAYAHTINSTGALNCISEYVPQHISESKTEIGKWVGVYLHDTTDFKRDEKAIDDCLEFWLDRRPERAADSFILKMSG